MSKVKGHFLRAWFGGGAIAISLVILVTMGWLSWRNDQKSLDDLALQLQSRASEQVREHLRGYLASPHKVIQLMTNAVNKGLVDLNKPETIYPYLLKLADVFDGVSYLNYGLEDGHFYGLGRISSNSPELHIEEAYPKDISKLYQFSLNSDATKGTQQAVLPFGNFFEQIWYSQPFAASEPIWTEIYNWEDNPSVIVIGAGETLRDNTGKKYGVAGVDLFLGEISHFLSTLNISQNGRVFIIDREGKFVATSNEKKIFRLDPDGPNRLSAFDAQDHVIRKATEILGDLPEGIKHLANVYKNQFKLDNESYYLHASPWNDSKGLDWLIVVAVPESDFEATIRANRNNLLIGLGAILIVGISIFVWLFGKITKPVLELRDAAQRVSDEHLDTRATTNSIFLEMNQLAHSFNHMVERLQKAFDIEERAREQLELKVAERTEELRIANEELERISQLDGLTKIANRRRFDPALNEEWERAKRQTTPLTVILCDIDFFKQYNDIYGHLQGDDALCKVAAILRQVASRPGDLIARFGGEEFVFILPNTAQEGAIKVAENVNIALKQTAIVHDGNPVGYLTMSFGIAVMDHEHNYDNPQKLLFAADTALYRAKAAGRNSIEYI